MNEQNRYVLAVCRTLTDLTTLMGRAPERQIVVATDDPEVETTAQQLPRVVRTVPLEGSRSLPEVWERSVKMTQQVNNYLLAQHKHSHPAVIKWIGWPGCEETTARIAEMLLLVDSYEKILGNDTDTLLLLRQRETGWEDDLLVATAANLGKEVIEVRGSSLPFSKRPGGATGGRAQLSAMVPQRVRLWWRRWALLSYGFLAAVIYPFVRRADKARNVVFLQADEDAAGLDRTILLQEEFERRDEWQPMTLCWRSPGSYTRMRKLDLSVAKLESWIPILRIPVILGDYRLARNLIRAAADFYDGDELTYRRVDLTPFLKDLVLRFTRYELLERITLFHALSHFLEVNHTLIVRTWDFGMSPLGAICQYLLAELEMRTGERRPLLFCDAGAPLNRYLPVQTHKSCDLILVAGEHDRAMSAKRGTPSDNMVVGGCMRIEEIRQFASQIHRADSAIHLDIRRSETCNLLYASPGVRRGYFSLQELRRTAVYLARLAREHPEATIVVQPHSGEEAQEWRHVVNRFAAPPNLHLVGHEISPHHCINFCDIVITKVSSLAFDAMELGKPVVAVSLDSDKRSLETYGEAVLKFSDLQDLDAFLQYVLSEPQHLAIWRDTAVAKQNEFMRSKILDPGEPVAHYMIDRVIALLGNEMTLRKTIRRIIPKQRVQPARAAAR